MDSTDKEEGTLSSLITPEFRLMKLHEEINQSEHLVHFHRSARQVIESGYSGHHRSEYLENARGLSEAMKNLASLIAQLPPLPDC